MCGRGRTIKRRQIPRFHTQVWYNDLDNTVQLYNMTDFASVGVNSIQEKSVDIGRTWLL